MASSTKRVEFVILKRRLNIGDGLFFLIVVAGAASIILTMAALIAVLTNEGWRSLTEFKFGFLTGTEWNPVTKEFGALPAIYGTVVSSLIGLAIAVPVSVGVAIFLAEVAPGPVRVPVSFFVEMLAALPSVVFGLWGLYIMAPWVRDLEKGVLKPWFGWTPIFDGPAIGFGMLASGIILAIMILPIITAISRDVLLAVPQSQREAAVALGATKAETIWSVVLPYARPGITGAVILGLGRAVGETIAVTMLIGNTYKINASILQPATTLASAIAAEFREAADPLYRSALIEMGLVLLVVALAINVIARLLVWRISTRAGGEVRL
ncbi:MAG TPA: phosphate ABC transporter permease subunit PstC [Dehalococcoidia bacterium]|jgi:phosphate transport system permease protein|nr:phosphate ABC transporter permease subunit PstC [Dehalococcoidia bacterium]